MEVFTRCFLEMAGIFSTTASHSVKTPSTERALIAALRERLQAQPENRSGRHGSVRLGIGDDCAILRVPRGHEVLLTTDMSLETMHFRRDWHSPESVGHRCLARGLSDLAAMGARPLAAFLSLALPPELTVSQRGRPTWRDRFLSGLLTLAQHHAVLLAGGDTAQSPARPGIRADNIRFDSTGLVMADIVLVGSAPRQRALLRSTAKTGDRIYVTGHLGGAAAELAALAAHPRRFAKAIFASGVSPTPHPHLFPQPRLAVGQFLLARRLATAAIDLSDGLSTDLDHLCEESGLGAVIDAACLPMHPLLGALGTMPLAAMEDRLHLALHGGEDYELLFTASPKTRLPRRIAGIPITCIGEMQSLPRNVSGSRTGGIQSRIQLLVAKDSISRRISLRPAGWEHYRSR